MMGPYHAHQRCAKAQLLWEPLPGQTVAQGGSCKTIPATIPQIKLQHVTAAFMSLESLNCKGFSVHYLWTISSETQKTGLTGRLAPTNRKEATEFDFEVVPLSEQDVPMNNKSSKNWSMCLSQDAAHRFGILNWNHQMSSMFKKKLPIDLW